MSLVLGLMASIGNGTTETPPPPPPLDPIPLDFEGMKFLALGDSITDGYYATNIATQAWAALIAAAKNGIEDRRGVPGMVLEDRVADNRQIFQLSNIPTKTSDYKYVFFNLGVNDMTLASYGFTVAAYTVRLQAVVDTHISKGWSASDLVLMTPFWITNNGAPRELQESYAQAVRDIAALNHTAFIDMYLGLKNTPAYASSGMADDLHPNDAGMIIIKDIIAAANMRPL